MGREYVGEDLRSGVVGWDSSVLFHSDFEGGIVPWVQTGDLINWDVLRVTSGAFADRFGLMLRSTGVLLPPVGSGELTARVPNGLDRRTTLDIRWRFVTKGRLRYLTFRLDGARREQAYGVGLRYRLSNSWWYAWVEPGLWAVLDDNPTLLSGESWHRIRFVVDWSTGKYVRFVIDCKEHPIAGKSFESTADGSNTECRISVGATTIDGVRTGVQFDEVLLYDGDLLRHG